MKSDTQSNNLRLVDTAEDSQEADPIKSTLESVFTNKWLFIGVCAACSIGALAAGGYAAWLFNKRDTNSVILDVKELLSICENRVAQIEAQIKRKTSASD